MTRTATPREVGGAPTYEERLPIPALAGTVRTVWMQSTGATPYRQRNLPTGGVELHVPIGGAPRLIGPLSGADVQVLPPRTTLLGVRFWPGAATPLLGLPATALLDRTVALADIWGPDATRIAEDVAGAPGPAVALEILQASLARRLAGAPRPDPLVMDAVRRLMPWEPVEIGSLTAQLAISPSQLRRRFLATVGTGPKVLQRTLRMQGCLALAQAAAGRPPAGTRLAELAVAVGYADHAHLSRECLRLTGVSPRELLGEDRCPCGHDHAASYGPFLAARPSTRVLFKTSARPRS